MRPAVPFAAKQLTLPRTEAMLLVDDREAEVCKLNILFDEGVCPDHECAMTGGRRSAHPSMLGGTEATNKKLNFEVGEGCLQVLAEAA